MKILRSIQVIAVVLLFSCSTVENKEEKKSEVASATIASENLSIMQLDKRLHEADSLVFVFYKDPQGDDSLRYTRFYKQYGTVDLGLIDFVRTNLNDSTQKLEKIKRCRSEGKIWCFRKGEIFQTVYFSSFNTDCSFLYIIKDGQFYYSSISAAMSKQLNELRPKAITPATPEK